MPQHRRVVAAVRASILDDRNVCAGEATILESLIEMRSSDPEYVTHADRSPSSNLLKDGSLRATELCQPCR
jgi:hypothetical protein